VTISSQAIVKI